MEKHAFDPEKMDSTSVYKILAGAIVPRPIGLISTVGRDGGRNVAPFSFFNALSHIPPLIGISIAPVLPSGRQKDTLRNVRDTGEFVANIVSEDLARAQDACAGEYGEGVDEFVVSGLTPIPSRVVRAPRVEQSPINFECRVVQIVPLPESVYTLVIGRVCLMHIRADVMDGNGRIDLKRLAAIGRLVGNAYCRSTDMFSLNHDTFAHLPSAAAPGASG